MFVNLSVGNMIVSAAIQDRRLNFSVKILYTNGYAVYYLIGLFIGLNINKYLHIKVS